MRCWFVKYYIFANNFHYNSFYKDSAYIRGHMFYKVPMYCINIRAFTFDVLHLMLSIAETITVVIRHLRLANTLMLMLISDANISVILFRYLK